MSILLSHGVMATLVEVQNQCVVIPESLPWWISSKESTCDSLGQESLQGRRHRRHRFDLCVRKLPRRRK